MTDIEHFLNDVARHKLTILHDDGIYRHLRFQAPESSNRWFELITVPGHLTIRGDMGAWAFERLPDVFELFRGPVDVGYFEEKCVAVSRHDSIRRFSKYIMRDWIQRDFDERKSDYTPEQQELIWVELGSLHNTVHDQIDALDALDTFNVEDYTFSDVCNLHFTVHSERFLWILNAIVWGIREYQAAKS